MKTLSRVEHDDDDEFVDDVACRLTRSDAERLRRFVVVDVDVELATVGCDAAMTLMRSLRSALAIVVAFCRTSVSRASTNSKHSDNENSPMRSRASATLVGLSRLAWRMSPDLKKRVNCSAHTGNRYVILNLVIVDRFN